MSRETATIRDEDLQMAEIYRDFLPKRIFDAHLHMYAEGTIPHSYGESGTFFRRQVTPADYLRDRKSVV